MSSAAKPAKVARLCVAAVWRSVCAPSYFIEPVTGFLLIDVNGATPQEGDILEVYEMVEKARA